MACEPTEVSDILRNERRAELRKRLLIAMAGGMAANYNYASASLMAYKAIERADAVLELYERRYGDEL